MTKDADPSLPRDQADLMARIEREWLALMAAANKLTREDMTRPGPGGWSVKDNLAHVAAWEQFLLRHYLGNEPFEVVMGIDKATFEGLDTDGINAVLYERNRDRSVEDVIDGLRRTHEQVLATLQRTPFSDLLRPYPPGDPNAGPVLSEVRWNTYAHYEGHLRNIERLSGES